MMERIPSDHDTRRALQILEAIGSLQRWLVEQPMGADGLYLTTITLVLVQGQDVVANVALSADSACDAR